jgi:hypothetical protein
VGDTEEYHKSPAMTDIIEAEIQTCYISNISLELYRCKTSFVTLWQIINTFYKGYKNRKTVHDMYDMILYSYIYIAYIYMCVAEKGLGIIERVENNCVWLCIQA